MLKFGTKNALFACFWARISSTYGFILNQHPQMCLILKFCRKAKMTKFGTKNALFEYLWVGDLKDYRPI